MPQPTVDTTALTKLARVFSVDTRKKILAEAGKRMGVKAESYVPEYPKASGKERPKIYTRDTVAGKKVTPFKTKFKSDKQAYYVLFVLKGIPYERTGLLGRSITSAISDLTGSSVTTRIGTAVRHAPLVIGNDEEQAAYHAGTWWQLNKEMTDNSDAIIAEGEDALKKGIERELKST
jgi:hypothetical protein